MRLLSSNHVLSVNFCNSRGQKATFHNPQYDLPPEVIEASKLPIDHPDFEMAEACPPRRLFASKLKRKSRDRNQDAFTNGSLDAKRAKIAHFDVSTSEGKKSAASISSRKRMVFSDGTEREPVFTKPQGSDKGAERLELLQYIRKGRERRNVWPRRMVCALERFCRRGPILSCARWVLCAIPRDIFEGFCQ